MALGWPNIDTQAELTLGCCGQQTVATVTQYSETACVLDAPEHGCEDSSDTETYLLAWLSQNNYWTRAVAVTGIETQPTPDTEVAPDDSTPAGIERTLWTLEARADTERFERRSFMRLDAEFPVTAVADNTELCAFTAVDISEHGLRGVIAAQQTGKLPENVSLHLHLDSSTLVVEACVAWTGTSTTTDGETLIGFMFCDPPESTTDAIRSYIFRLQMIRRREENEKTARL